jgi:hypothetical protein
VKLRVTVADQRRYLDWSAPICGTPRWPDDTEAVAIVDETDAIRGVMLLNLRQNDSCMVHFASDGSRRWATRKTLEWLFGYLFLYKRMTRVCAITPVHNIETIVSVVRLGFQFEGRQRAGSMDGSDAIMLGMLASDCRWIKPEDHHG